MIRRSRSNGGSGTFRFELRTPNWNFEPETLNETAVIRRSARRLEQSFQENDIEPAVELAPDFAEAGDAIES
jgi:hypothetical protein